MHPHYQCQDRYRKKIIVLQFEYTILISLLSSNVDLSIILDLNRKNSHGWIEIMKMNHVRYKIIIKR